MRDNQQVEWSMNLFSPCHAYQRSCAQIHCDNFYEGFLITAQLSEDKLRKVVCSLETSLGLFLC